MPKWEGWRGDEPDVAVSVVVVSSAIITPLA